MAEEIERKFLVVGDDWRGLAPGIPYCQGYVPTQTKTTVRIRIAGDQGYLTLKGPTQGLTRSEFEYPIPLKDAEAMLAQLCPEQPIAKIRYRIPYQDHIWEVDEFTGNNQGLVLAEIELGSETESFASPPWIGQEISHDFRYRNSYLSRHPFQTWTQPT